MKIVVFSDTHDHWEYIEVACKKANSLGAQIMIHCGDVCAPSTLGYLLEQWGKEIHYCFGNVDGDRFLMMQKFGNEPLIHHHGEALGEVELGGKKIAFQHYPEIARALASEEKYDAVFYGHDHKKNIEKVGDTILANPGNLANIKAPPSFAIYNTEDNMFTHYDISE